MKVLVLLAAIFLVAIQAQADPLPARTEEALDQEQFGAEDQDVPVDFTGDEGSALRAAGLRSIFTCYCRRGTCRSSEQRKGRCGFSIMYNLCCR
ncbi:alpha-defensin 4-like [Tupaia chinensis]|uniref:Defensin-5 n=1 Tax=Tupaia chinensis TaxID=246437 RepID=L8YGP1_TUPCH|nr:alpha-defensin 4-like [Tupaia chinensis]ELV14230.1 Defensin-5 [Tupaia chinensis]